MLKILNLLQIETPRQDRALLQGGVSVGYGFVDAKQGSSLGNLKEYQHYITELRAVIPT